MKRLLIIILLLATSLFAEELPVGVYPSWKEKNKVEPRGTVTAVFRIRNTSGRRITLVPELVLPENWRLIVPLKPLTLDSGQSGISFANLFIPEESPAGDYTLEYLLRDEDKILAGRMEFVVQVLPAIGLELLLKKAPSYAISGESFNVAFLLVNRSNTALNIALDISSSGSFVYTIEGLQAESVFLKGGESREIVVRVETPPEMVKKVNYRLHVRARPLDGTPPDSIIKSKIPVSANSDVEIIPGLSDANGTYHTLPAEILFGYSGLFSEDSDSWATAGITGKGTLDEEGEKHLEFLLRKELQASDAVINDRNDRYSLKYWTDDEEIWAGDHVYSLSPLIESGRFGRGLLGRMNFNQLSLGSFFMSPVFENAEDRYTAGFIDYYGLDPLYPKGYRYKANANVYSKSSDSILWGLYQEVRPTENSNLELEVASGKGLGKDDDGALSWSGLLKGHFAASMLDTSLSFLIAEPDFTGTYSDQYQARSDFRFAFLERSLMVFSGLSHEQHNYLLDESKNTAASVTGAYIGSRYYWTKPKSDLGFNWRVRNRVDRMENPDFNNLDNFISLDYNRSFSFFDLSARADWTIENDKLASAIGVQQRYSASFTRSPDGVSSYNFKFWYFKALEENTDPLDLLSFGCGYARKEDKADWNINLYNVLHYESGEYAYSDLSLTANLNFLFDKKNSLISSFTYYQPLQRSGSHAHAYLSIYYNRKTDLPVSRKMNTGVLEGRIFEKAAGTPLKNIIIRIADKVVVSDDRGRFRTSGLSPGDHNLEIGTERAGLHLVPDRKTPISVSIQKGKTTQIDIGMVGSASLEGNVQLFAVPENGQRALDSGLSVIPGQYSEEELVRKSGYPNVLLTLEREDEVRRLYSDHNGRFSFQEIRPGRWTLFVDKGALPDDLYFVEHVFEIVLAPGGKGNAELKIFPKRVIMKSLEKGGLLTLAKKKPVLKADEKEEKLLFEVMDRMKTPMNRNTPELLLLDWMISFQDAEKALLEEYPGISGLTHISALTRLDQASIDKSERRDLDSLPEIHYLFHGLVAYGLPGRGILRFYNPRNRKDQLYLSGVELQLAPRNGGSAEELRVLYWEILHVFLSKWNVEMDADTRKKVEELGVFTKTIGNIDVSYRLDTVDIKIMIAYKNDSLRRLIESGVYSK